MTMSTNYQSPIRAELPPNVMPGRPRGADSQEIVEIRATLNRSPGEWFVVATVSHHNEAQRIRVHLNRDEPEAKRYAVSSRASSIPGDTSKIVYAQKVSAF